MNSGKAWYKSWFDTEYYHILYRHRDDNEAQLFIRNLVEELGLSDKEHILDLACGRGRHAIFLSELGFEVTGLDLSESNIEFAKRFENDRLHLEVGDMRKPFGQNRFDCIFNLFTSFGYFESREENLQALRMMKFALRPGGMLVLDFMNVNKVKPGLVKKETLLVKGIEFLIERFIRDEQVVKKISFRDKGHFYHFEERVQLLDKDAFEELFALAGFHITNIYGDFELNNFDFRESERLILLAE